MRTALLFTLMVSTLAACSPESSTTVSTGPADGSLQSARSSKVRDSRANWVFADSVNVAAAGNPDQWTPAGIRGDGRLKTGEVATGSPSNQYEGDVCGVYGMLGSTATFNVDPDINWTSTMQSSCGGKRLFNFYLNGLTGTPTPVGPHSTVDSFSTLAVGASTTREARFGVQLSMCDGLRFTNEFPPSTNALVTRLPDVVTPTGVGRQWRIESQGSHLAACIVRGKAGRISFTGATYYLPFSILVTEEP